MEVKPSVVEISILEFLVEASELVANLLLRSFFIDEVDQVLLLVHRLRVLEMKLSCHFWILKVLLYLNWRAPFKIGFHAPNQRNRSSNLHIACNIHMTFFKVHKHMFCFSEVGRISICVQSSADESPSRSPAVFSREQVKICLCSSFEGWWTQIDITQDTWNLERRVFDALELPKELIVISIVRNVVHTVRIHLPHNVVLALRSVLALGNFLEG